MYLAFRFSTRELLALCIWALGIAGICSAFMALFIPKYGIGTDAFEGIWLGVYGHKNSLGSAMAIGFLAALLLLRFTRPIRFRYMLFAGFMLSLVYLSDSTTSLVICLVSPLLLWGAQIIVAPSPRILWRRVGLTLSAAILVAVLFFHFEGVTNAFGRDETFTGRTAIWALVMQAILDRPLLGYGYEAFWQSYEGPSGETWKLFGQPFSNAHNGFLEMWLGVGLLGLVAVSLAIAVLFRWAFRGMSRRFCLDTGCPGIFLFFLLLSNLTEATLLKANMLGTILLLTIVGYSYEFSWRRSQHWHEP
jgi:O-antigen ligase